MLQVYKERFTSSMLLSGLIARNKTKCEANPCPDGLRCLALETASDYKCVDPKATTCQYYSDLGFTTSGIYTLIQDGKQLVQAYCDLEDEGGGWIVFVRNNAPSPNIFNQDWETYANGFGDLASNFWWGNEFLHIFTKDVPHELKIVMETTDGKKPTAKYTGFQISSRTDGYYLLFDKASFTYTDLNALPKLDHNQGMRFSTPDRDVDNSPQNCAAERSSGWWYNYCSYCKATKNPPYWGGWAIEWIEFKIRPMKV